MEVVTYQTTANQKLSICPACEQTLRDADLWPRTAHSYYCHASYGLHWGHCDVHDVVDAAIAGDAEIAPYIALT